MADWDAVRKDFPILAERRDGKPIVYFDSACMGLKPYSVIDAMNSYYLKFTACHGRSAHKFSREMDGKYEGVRGVVAKFINARSEKEIIFTVNTTHGINTVANGLRLAKGDEVVTLDIEHSSNNLPWQKLAREKGIVRKVAKTNPDGSFNRDNFAAALSNKTKLVSLVHVSNVFGTMAPAKEIAKMAHERGALFMLDAAQSAPHVPIDVRSIDCDFLAFSGHKLYGPTGTGVLYGKSELLGKLEPLMVGGGSVTDSTYESCTLETVPERFEAGLQNYSGVIGLGAAVAYVNKIGMRNIEARDSQLARRLFDTAMGVEGLKIISSPSSAEPLLTFNMENIGPHEVAAMLDEIANIFVRSGRHCVHPWFNAHGMKGSVRASLAFYNTEAEIELFGETLKKIGELA